MSAASPALSSARGFVRTLIVDDITSGDRGFARGPVRALMSALLFDGIQAYLNHFSSSHGRDSRRYSEAYQWVHRHGNDYIFSFENVCEALGVDPEYLRIGLLNSSAEKRRKKARRTF